MVRWWGGAGTSTCYDMLPMEMGNGMAVGRDTRCGHGAVCAGCVLFSRLGVRDSEGGWRECFKESVGEGEGVAGSMAIRNVTRSFGCNCIEQAGWYVGSASIIFTYYLPQS